VQLRPYLAAFVLSAIAAAAACSSNDDRACRVGADCASGVCGADGKCVGTTGATPPPGSTPPAGSDGGDVPPSGGEGGTDASLPGCVPNHDGTIDRAEVPIKAGLHATFRIAQNVDITTAGTKDASGKRTWDLSQPLSTDENVLVETTDLSGKWFASSFGGASYTTKLAASSDLIGVFETSTTSLGLRGVVSPDDGLTKTELSYSPSPVVLSFPLTAGAKWSTKSDVSGTAQGYPAAYSETYDDEVDATGKLLTPLGSFDVLRVKVTLTRTVGIVTTVVRSFAFVGECYGTVATITSGDNETDAEFTHAAEVRRIAP